MAGLDPAINEKKVSRLCLAPPGRSPKLAALDF
jgi:hypothetical protein